MQCCIIPSPPPRRFQANSIAHVRSFFFFCDCNSKHMWLQNLSQFFLIAILHVPMYQPLLSSKLKTCFHWTTVEFIFRRECYAKILDEYLQVSFEVLRGSREAWRGACYAWCMCSAQIMSCCLSFLFMSPARSRFSWIQITGSAQLVWQRNALVDSPNATEHESNTRWNHPFQQEESGA